MGLLPEEGRGPSIQTYTGLRFHVLNPTPDEVNIFDIAHALANICRYTGHSSKFYSVAQHSFLCSYHVPEELALHALLHDAHEAYLGDSSRPLKWAFDRVAPGVIKDIEHQLDTVLGKAFGLSLTNMDPSVKDADNLLLATEKRDLMPMAEDWPGLPEPLVYRIDPWSPQRAEQMFLGRYVELSGSVFA